MLSGCLQKKAANNAGILTPLISQRTDPNNTTILSLVAAITSARNRLTWRLVGPGFDVAGTIEGAKAEALADSPEIT